MIDKTADIEAQTRALLEPGEIDLVGVIVETGLSSEADLEMMETTVEIGECIAAHADDGPTYVYSGNDDDRFASNLHQGLTVEGDDFVWECQQLLVEGTFTLVFYFEADVGLEAVLDDLETTGYDVSGVRV